MPKTDVVATTPRRRLLATAALISPAAVLPTVAALAAEDGFRSGTDPHLAWAAELRELDDYFLSPAYEALPDAEADHHPRWPRWLELQRLIARTPSRTLAGAREQVWVIGFNHRYGMEMGSDEERAMELALATLDRLMGESRHA